MQTTKCLICRRKFEWNESMYRFCDDCLDVIDALGVDWDEAEKKLMKIVDLAERAKNRVKKNKKGNTGESFSENNKT